MLACIWRYRVIKQHTWSDKQLKTLIQCVEQCKPYKEIVQLTGKRLCVVQRKLEELDLRRQKNTSMLIVDADKQAHEKLKYDTRRKWCKKKEVIPKLRRSDEVC